MGFDLQRFEGNVDEELMCSICSSVYDDPIQSPACEHTFCRECIRQWCLRQSTCPVDRSPLAFLQLRPAPRIMRNLLARLKIRCDNFQHGCQALLRLEKLRSHLPQCEFDPKRPVPCQRGCGLPVPKDELNSHNCARDLQKMLAEQKNWVSGLRDEVKNQGQMLLELKRDVQQIKDFTRTLRMGHSNLRVLLERSERDEVLRWSRALPRTRVSRWNNLIATPDALMKLLIKTALMDSRCPDRAVDELATNCHERSWPRGLATLRARESNQDLLDDYICRRLPGQQAVLVLSSDNGHMGEDMMIEPGIVIIFSNGFD